MKSVKDALVRTEKTLEELRKTLETECASAMEYRNTITALRRFVCRHKQWFSVHMHLLNRGFGECIPMRMWSPEALPGNFDRDIGKVDLEKAGLVAQLHQCQCLVIDLLRSLLSRNHYIIYAVIKCILSLSRKIFSLYSVFIFKAQYPLHNYFLQLISFSISPFSSPRFSSFPFVLPFYCRFPYMCI